MMRGPFIALCVSVFTLVGSLFYYVSPKGGFKTRTLASQSDAITPSELQDFYHLSEGSDIFPYDWIIRIKSVGERDRTGNWERGFFEGIESRVNVIRNPHPDTYLMDYIGLTAAWSGHRPEDADALKSDPEVANDKNGLPVQLRRVQGIPSTRMVGVNCAFCHTGKVVVGDDFKIIEGGQAEVNLQELYGDMVISTLALLINFENQLEDFLVNFGYERAEAAMIAKEFAKQSLKDAKLTSKLKLFLTSVDVIKEVTPWFLEKEVQNIASRLKELFRLTHRIPKDESLGNELEKRFDYLAKFAAGHPKYTTQGATQGKTRFQSSHDGFGRLEAFISAGNRVFRDRSDWVNSDAAVGFPGIWGMGDKAIFHYTGNTNSILIRNIGQSMGLGAIFLDKNYNTTVNIHNLSTLEDIAYKIKSPRWEETFDGEFGKGDAFKINQELAIKGRAHYEKNCMGCHEPKKVGPQGDLNYYGIYDLNKLGTDPNLAVQITKSINASTEYSNIFAKTGLGIIDSYRKTYGVENGMVQTWLKSDRRGKEWIRETYNKKYVQYQGKESSYPEVPTNSGYVARSLKGAWATAPYLHNNSVPTLWDMLLPAKRRPKIFERGLNAFDPKLVGLKQRFTYSQDREALMYKVNSKNQPFIQVIKRMEKCEFRPGVVEERTWRINICFDTKDSGNSNSGHEFGVDLKEYEKLELIEYLKTL